jgi:hypothetical protein
MRRSLEAEPLDEEQRKSRRRKIRTIVAFYAVAALSALALPMPGAVRVIVVLISVLVVPIILVSEFDVVKRR